MNQQVFDISDIKIPKEKIMRYLNLLWLVPLLILALGSWYTVQPDEAGVIQRFGRFSRTETPGLHFKIPLMETVTKVAIKRQQKMEFGFRTLQAGIRSQYSTRSYYDESMMLTGDLSIGEVARHDDLCRARACERGRWRFRRPSPPGSCLHVDACLRVIP